MSKMCKALEDMIKDTSISTAVRVLCEEGLSDSDIEKIIIKMFGAKYGVAAAEAKEFIKRDKILEAVKAASLSNASTDEILSNIMTEFNLGISEARKYIIEVCKDEKHILIDREKEAAVSEIIETALRYNISEEEIISYVKKGFESDRTAEQ